jgi:hypothetical protein
MATFFSIVDIDENCPYHDEMVAPQKSIPLPSKLADLWKLLELNESDYLSFFDDFVLIESCLKCDSVPLLGYADLMKKKGTCASCGEQRQDKSFNRVSFDDPVSQIELQSEFFPYKSLLQLVGQKNITISIEGESIG